MKSLLLEEFLRLVPTPDNGMIREIYESSFKPPYILAHFQDWEYDASCNCFIDATEERNLIMFGPHTYCINGRELRRPLTLNDFILDCRSSQVSLRWSEATADKLWLTPAVGASDPSSRHNGSKQVDGKDHQ